jgi:hypothetical protein
VLLECLRQAGAVAADQIERALEFIKGGA